jgi:hypothetical protein
VSPEIQLRKISGCLNFDIAKNTEETLVAIKLLCTG